MDLSGSSEVSATDVTTSVTEAPKKTKTGKGAAAAAKPAKPLIYPLEVDHSRDDLITAVDSQPITSYVQFNRIIAIKSPGAKVAIQIRRDGREYTLNVEVGEETKTK